MVLINSAFLCRELMCKLNCYTDRGSDTIAILDAANTVAEQTHFARIFIRLRVIQIKHHCHIQRQKLKRNDFCLVN